MTSSVDVLVALTHLGVDDDARLAARLTPVLRVERELRDVRRALIDEMRSRWP